MTIMGTFHQPEITANPWGGTSTLWITNLMKGNSITKGVRRKSVIFLVGKKNTYVFTLPWLLINLYLKQTGNIAQSRRSIQTAWRFPESRSAKSKAWIRWLTNGRDPRGQGWGVGGRRRLPGQSAGRHPRWASGEGKARPGNRGWRTPHYFGSSTCKTKAWGIRMYWHTLVAVLRTRTVRSSHPPPALGTWAPLRCETTKCSQF